MKIPIYIRHEDQPDAKFSDIYADLDELEVLVEAISRWRCYDENDNETYRASGQFVRTKTQSKLHFEIVLHDDDE